ncbi:hypothetical protein FORC47_p279 (plasmid) [Bacillus cereus]|nr:hypothetical protein FORC47_p279 [Bacillus cereus]
MEILEESKVAMYILEKNIGKEKIEISLFRKVEISLFLK